MKKVAFPLVVLLIVCGCFSAQSLTDNSFIEYDKHTQYAISNENSNGFTLTVYYGRYQFFTSRGEITWEAFEKLQAIAQKVAQERGKEIQPIEKENLITSYGRNPVTGTTTCHCQAEIKYRTP